MKQLLSTQLRRGRFSQVATTLSKAEIKTASYETLQQIVEKMSEQTELCERSLAVAQDSFSSKALKVKQSLYGLAGFEYQIPSVEESFTNQLHLVSQYNGCLDVLINQGEAELKQLQQRVDELEMYSADSDEKVKQFDNELESRIASYEKNQTRKTKRDIIAVTNKLGLKKIHTDISQTVLTRLDALEQFLTDAVFTTQKLREEGRGYEHFLYSAIRPYLALGLNTKCVTAIHEQMGTLKDFTNHVESHVADSLAHIQVLSHQSYSGNDAILKKATELEKNRLSYLQQNYE